MDSSETTIRLSDGAETTVETWGARGPVMLCVHGMTSSRKSWERLARRLAGRFRVSAYDQRGHGDSAAFEGPMTLARSLRDVHDVMEALGDPIDVLMGHSWGGAVALLAGDVVASRVVAVDPMLRQAGSQWYAEFLSELNDIFALHGEARDQFVRDEYQDWEEIDRERKVHAVRTMTARPIERLRDENPPETWQLVERAAAFPVPLLLAFADPAEGINDPADVAAIGEAHNPNLDVRIFEGQGHNLHRTDFERFCRTLDGFLERTAGAAAGASPA